MWLDVTDASRPHRSRIGRRRIRNGVCAVAEAWCSCVFAQKRHTVGTVPCFVRLYVCETMWRDV
jgi:hypothetical protein